MYNEKTYITHDRVEASLDTGSLKDSYDGDNFDLDEERVVTVNNPPWQNAFNTDEFYVTDATVARPIEQTYYHDGESKTFKKPAEELKKSAWSLDNKPFTVEHPETGRVKGVDDVRGFWRNPSYNEDACDLDAELYIPINDDEALEYVSENEDVSVGFSHRLRASDEDGVDAHQVDIYYDHVAAVEEGRCPSEKGCGIAVDNEVVFSSDFSVGDFVKGDSGGGTWHGKVVDRKTDGCFSERIDGDQKICADNDDPVLLIENYDPQEGGTGTMVAHNESSVNEWSYSSDEKGGSLEELDLTPPKGAQEAAQKALDWKEEYDVDAMTETGWARARQLASGEELSPADIADGTDGMANWWARHKGHALESENEDKPWKDNGYVAGRGWGAEIGMNWAMRMDEKIKDIRNQSEDSVVYRDDYHITPPHGVSNDTDGGVTGIYFEGDYRDEDDKYYAISPEEGMGKAKYPIANCSDADDAWKLRGHGDYRISQETLEERIKRRAEDLDCDDMPWEDSENNSNDNTMTDDNCDCKGDGSNDDGGVSFDASSFSIDYLREKNDAVDELYEEKQELEQKVDEKDDKIDELREEVDEYREKEKESIVDSITDITDTWDEDELMEQSLDELGDRLELAKDATESVGTANSTSSTDDSPQKGRVGGTVDPLDKHTV